MITALEALALPSALLTDDEKAGADRLEAKIEEQVLKNMKRAGIGMATEETNDNVIGEVNQRLKAVGYAPIWTRLMRSSRFNAASQECVGFQLSLSPNDEAYRAAARAILS